MDKSEYIGKKIELWQPIIKAHRSGKVTYEAVLSDDSTDRDDEVVGKKALRKIEIDDKFIVGLVDHENKVFNQVCEWVNKRIERRNGHTAFIAEPKFFLSNPKAQQLKGMLDEGASIGISIGAIIKDFEMKEVDGKEKRVFTDLELLEASFVAVPANAHARIMAVAKMFKNEEGINLTEKKYTEKEFNDISVKADNLDKEVNDLKVSLDKSVKEKDAAIKELTELKESSKDASGKVADAEKALAEKVKELDANKEKNTEIEKELEKIKNDPLYKGNFEQDVEATQKEAENIKEALEKGNIPVILMPGGM